MKRGILIVGLLAAFLALPVLPVDKKDGKATPPAAAEALACEARSRYVNDVGERSAVTHEGWTFNWEVWLTFNHCNRGSYSEDQIVEYHLKMTQLESTRCVSNWRDFRMDITAMTGVNPPVWEFRCNPGQRVYQTWRRPGTWIRHSADDRCFNFNWRIVQWGPQRDLTGSSARRCLS